MSGTIEKLLKIAVMVGLVVTSIVVVHSKYEEHQTKSKETAQIEKEEAELKKFFSVSNEGA